MSSGPLRHIAALLVSLAMVLGTHITPAAAAPTSATVAADRAALNRALSRLSQAQDRVRTAQAQASQLSTRLDSLLAEQRLTENRLSRRAWVMYRTGDAGFLDVLIGASTFEDFATRWTLLTRMNDQDAADIRELEAKRADIKRAATRLLGLQDRAVRELAALEASVAAARKELASSKAALAQYERRRAAVQRPSAPGPRTIKRGSSMQGKSGSGAWKTAVASHYSKTFTGRGASGERIGPYSMMCAHKTLPFGTLVEFEYGGKRAVAKVTDRGPYTAGREFDLGPGVVRVLDFSGVHEVRYRVIGQ